MSLGDVIPAPTHLTVIIADPMPLVMLADLVTHRRVTIALTDDQQSALALKVTAHSGGSDYAESYSTMFLESEEQ